MSVHDRTLSPVRASTRSESGVAMLSTLVVVVILGVLVTVVLSNSPGSKSKGGSNSSTQTTITTTPKSIGTEAQLAAVSGCEANYTSVVTAVQTYSAENGSPPPAGTAWATSTSGGGPFIASWPADPKYYSIVWNGVSVVVVPAKGVASHGSQGTSSPPTGCYAA
jgi:type II secretory pathway pseudopilin PulG